MRSIGAVIGDGTRPPSASSTSERENMNTGGTVMKCRCRVDGCTLLVLLPVVPVTCNHCKQHGNLMKGQVGVFITKGAERPCIFTCGEADSSSRSKWSSSSSRSDLRRCLEPVNQR